MAAAVTLQCSHVRTVATLQFPVLLHVLPAGVDAVGAGGQGDPFDFRCPQGAYIHRYRGYVGPARFNWIYGLGPLGCSDGSNSSVLWGSTSSRGKNGVPFDQGIFRAEFQGLDVAFDNSKAISKLNFTSCSGGVVGENAFSSFPRSASLRCPSDMQVVGVHGVADAKSYGLINVGLYCI